MKKIIKSLALLFLITVLSNISLYAKNSISSYGSESIVASPPTVNSPVYYCIGSVATPLTATPSVVGATLKWYALAVGGVGSLIAPTPSTTTVGTTSYFVSETPVAGIESTRSEIVVNVVADNGGVLTPFCDLANTTATSVAFDWNNIIGYLGYNFSYSIAGGPDVPRFQVSPSHYDVPVTGPGISVTLNILSVLGMPCVKPISITCHSTCTAAQNVAPTFTIPTSYCINEVLPNLPITSTNVPAITGTWNTSAINTATAGTTNYIFTPDPILFPCALTKTLTVKVGLIEPDFVDFSVCSGTTPADLNTVSPNGIAGTWFPSIIDNTTSGSYVFTPDPDQPCSPTVKTINITVNPSNTIVNVNWTVTDAFAKNQIVTVTDPVGANYLYQLDDGPFQVNPIFENVAFGNHSITVADVNGCSVITNDNVFVINYPKYFTPNGDSYNDTWNIFSLKDQLVSRIYIFDRYGKLLKDISPKGSGWDGMYNGQAMPANDYWFSVEYMEQDIYKKFKSHFSLKR